MKVNKKQTKEEFEYSKPKPKPVKLLYFNLNPDICDIQELQEDLERKVFRYKDGDAIEFRVLSNSDISCDNGTKYNSFERYANSGHTVEIDKEDVFDILKRINKEQTNIAWKAVREAIHEKLLYEYCDNRSMMKDIFKLRRNNRATLFDFKFSIISWNYEDERLK